MSKFFKLMRKGTDEYYGSPIDIKVFIGTQQAVESALQNIKSEMEKNGLHTTGFDKMFWSEPAEVHHSLPELSLYYAQGSFRISSFGEALSGRTKPEIEFDIKAQFQGACDVRLVDKQPVELEKKRQREGKQKLLSETELKSLMLGKEVIVKAFGFTAEKAIQRAKDHAQFLVDSTIQALIKRNFIQPERQIDWFNEQRELLKRQYQDLNKAQAEHNRVTSQLEAAVARPKIKALNDTRSMLDIMAEEQANKKK